MLTDAQRLTLAVDALTAIAERSFFCPSSSCTCTNRARETLAEMHGLPISLPPENRPPQ